MLEPLGLGLDVLFPGDELDLELEGDGVVVTLLDALRRVVLHLQTDAVAAVLAKGQLDLPQRGAVGADLLLRRLHLHGKQSPAGGALGAGVLDPFEPAALAFPVADRIADELEFRRFLEVGDREDVLEGGLQAGVLALLRQQVHLEEFGVRADLNIEQVRH
jgi:hypothetical protein